MSKEQKQFRRKDGIYWGLRFFSIITLLLLFIGGRYLTSYTFPSEPVAVLYALIAYAGQISLFGYVPWLLILFPLTLIIPKKRIIQTVSVILVSGLIAILLLDTLLFAQNRFHLGLLTISILGAKTWGFAVFYFVIALVFTSKIAKLAEKPFPRKVAKVVRVAVPLLFIFFQAATHLMHAVADSRYYSPITRFTTQLPLFYPATARRFMVKHGIADLDAAREHRDLESMQSNSRGAVKYPIEPLSFDTAKREYNLLLILFDGMRADLLSEEITPNLSAFSKRSSQFTNHFSGGNSTRMGVFSLFYGLPSTYWQDFIGIQQASAMVEEFRTSGYKMGIYGSHTLDNPASLDRTAFSNIKDLRMTTEGDFAPYEKDGIITEEWMKWLGHNGSEPFFGFLFYDNPVAKSVPSEKRPAVEGTKQAKEKALFVESMKTADSLVGVVLSDLEKSGKLENTVVIITGDHGEEFDENGLGFTGHGTAYSSEQTHVPLIVYHPQRKAEVVSKRTSHADIVATVMEEVLHCENPATDYCSGNSVFSDSEWNWLITGSYYNYAILEPGQVTVSYPGGYYEVRDSGYSVISNKNLNRKNMQEALNEMSRFYK